MLVITALNRMNYRDELEDMFRMRHRMLVGERGWSDLGDKDGLEKDDFDHDQAIYLVTKTGDDVSGCIRMVPSLWPNLTANVFPHLCDIESLPVGEDVYDSSRIVVDTKARRGEKYSHIAGEIMCAWYEAGLALGLSTYTGVIDTGFLTLGLSTGWDVTALGTPNEVGGESIVAVKFPITEAQLNLVRQLRGIKEPILSKADVELLRVNHRIVHYGHQQKVA